MFNICVIGCGYITRASHGPAYRRYALEHPDVRLAACCDVDPQRVEEIRERHGFERGYTNVDQMLERERPDAVCLNVPVHLTAELGARILRLGFPLLTEKPPALTTAALDPLIAAADEAARRGVIHQVAFNRRFAPLVVALKERLAGRHIIHVEHTFTRVNRRDPDFTTTAIHGIDTLRHLLGDYAALRMQYPPLEAKGADGGLPSSPGLPAFFLSGNFQSGATVHMTFQPLSGLASERTVIYTPGATFDLRLNHALDAPGSLFHYENNRLVDAINAAELCGSTDDFLLSGFYGVDAAFFDAVREGRQTEHTLASARQSVAVMEYLRDRREEF